MDSVESSVEFNLLSLKVVKSLLCVLVADIFCHVGEPVCGLDFRGESRVFFPSLFKGDISSEYISSENEN